MIQPASERQAAFGDLLEDQLVEQLAEYDEQLRCGTGNGSTDSDLADPSTPLDLRATLEELEQVWPRRPRAANGSDEPARIGRFIIERTLGQGGYGIVYLALDPALGRHVALKVPRLHALSDSDLLERFRREARAAAALDHPNIVPVHETGQIGQVYYIASAYCPGLNLAQWLRQRSPAVAPATAAKIVACLAEAVHYSHTRGVLHRDIKPGNVMLVPHAAEQPGADLPFVPRLTDFGLAKLVEQGLAEATQHPQAMTATDQMLGTPAYMAPEQAGVMTGGTIGPASDVYSLGAVLYELLTGHPPFQGTHIADVLNQVAFADPAPLRRVRRDVPRDLETICLKCLQKEPQRRYFSAQQLADDLHNLLEDRPIAARPPGTLATAAKWVRRRPALASLIAVVFIALTGIAVQRSLHVSTVEQLNSNLAKSNVELKDALAKARVSETEARESEHAALNLAYAADMNNAWRAREEGDVVGALNLLDRYRNGTQLADYRGLEWHYMDRGGRTTLNVLWESKQPIYSLTCSPTGEQLVVTGLEPVLRSISPELGTLFREWTVPQGDINSASFSPDQTKLATADESGAICWWDMDVDKHALNHSVVAHPEGACEVLYYPGSDESDHRWVTSGRDPVIRLWRGTEPDGTLEHHGNAVEELVLHPDGRRLISMSSLDKAACIWDLAERRLVHVLGPGTAKMRHVAVSVDGRWVATCNTDVVQLWGCDDGRLVYTFQPLDTPERVCFAFSPSALCVADKAGHLTTLRLDVDKLGGFVGMTVERTWEAHVNRIYALTARQNELISAGKDGRIIRWKREATMKIDDIDIQHVDLTAIAFDTERQQMLTAGEGGIRFWDCKNAAAESAGFVVAPPYHSCSCVAVSQDSDRFAGGTWPLPFVHFWKLSDRTLQKTIELPELGGVADVSFSRDGSMLAAVTDTTVYLLATDTGEVRGRIPLEQGRTAPFSPNEAEFLYLPLPTHSVRCLNWRSERVVFETPELPERPSRIAFTPDGRQMLTGGNERFIRVWDAQTGAFLHMLQGHRVIVTDFSVSPDGRTVAGIDKNGEVKLWHLASGKFLMNSHLSPGTHQAPCLFSPDGTWLIAGRGVDAATLIALTPYPPVRKPPPIGHASDASALPLPSVPAISAPVPTLIDVNVINDINDLEFSPDGQLLAVTDDPETNAVATLIDVQSQSVQKHLELSGFMGAQIVHFSADGTQLFSRVRQASDRPPVIGHWNLESGEGKVEPEIRHVSSFDVVPQDADKIVIGHLVGALKLGKSQLSLWNCETGTIEQVLRSTVGSFYTVAVSRDGRHVFNESESSAPAIIDMDSRSILPVADNTLRCVWSAFHPSGNHLAASLDNDQLVLFDVKLGRPVESVARRDSPVFYRIEYSADGRFLAFASTNSAQGGKVMVWDSTLQRCLYVLPVEGHRVAPVAWSPDGRTLAAGLYREDGSPGPDIAIWKFTDEQLANP